MSDHSVATGEQAHDVDPIEAVTSVIPLVIPAFGALVIFILAMIAVSVG